MVNLAPAGMFIRTYCITDSSKFVVLSKEAKSYSLVYYSEE